MEEQQDTPQQLDMSIQEAVEVEDTVEVQQEKFMDMVVEVEEAVTAAFLDNQ